MRVFRHGVASAAIIGLTFAASGTAAAGSPGAAALQARQGCAADQAANAAVRLGQAACAKGHARPAAVPRTAAAAAAAARQALHAQIQVCGPPFVKQDPRLGPLFLPRTGYFGFLLRGYVRYGGLSPLHFLYQYWDVRKLPDNDWRYPPDDGFAHQLRFINSHPLRFRVPLRVGQYIDRFGRETGRFLSPAGAPFPSRGLPPSNLNTSPDDPAHLCSYHLYRVTRRFDVDAGPAEPAFQQPGGGTQYVLNSDYVLGAPTPLSVQWLADNGYLRRIY